MRYELRERGLRRVIMVAIRGVSQKEAVYLSPQQSVAMVVCLGFMDAVP